ncbi:hypothetical protein EV284_0726 [Streptomyces sp. BK022]|nr:hypothetical protein EV284_0726 [Streptomyces sp. BK022]
MSPTLLTPAPETLVDELTPAYYLAGDQLAA